MIVYVRKKWEPDVKIRIPAGAEFINRQPESTNHFISVFVYQRRFRTLHVDDTIMYAEKSGFLLKLFGLKDDVMAFHPSMKTSHLHSTADASYLFRDILRNMLRDWPFNTICCVHMGVRMGETRTDVATLLNSVELLFY